jgi:hypothetical protein
LTVLLALHILSILWKCLRMMRVGLAALTTSSVNSILTVPIKDIIVALYEEFTNSLRRVIKYDIIIFNENSKSIRPINTMKRSLLKSIIKRMK